MTYGATLIDPRELTDEYEFVDEAENLKAKVWTPEKGDSPNRVYLRVRRHDDSRRFKEFYIPFAVREDLE